MDLIPFEDKWRLINHSTYIYLYLCSERVEDLIPYEEKWNLINDSIYLFRGGGDLIPYEEWISLVESFPVKLMDVSARY